MKLSFLCVDMDEAEVEALDAEINHAFEHLSQVCDIDNYLQLRNLRGILEERLADGEFNETYGILG